MLNFDEMPRFKSQSYKIIEMIPIWAKTFDVDEKAIIRQIKWANGWCWCNPKKAPKKNVVRFLFNWMTRAKKMGNLVSVERKETYKEARPSDDELPTAEDFKAMKEDLRKK